ncbi:BglG family transcription antiterminator [Enterococcus sp. LJL90]
MKDLTRKEFALLKFLLGHKQPVLLESLAIQLNVGKRTTQTLIDSLNYRSSKYKQEIIKSIPSSGVIIPTGVRKEISVFLNEFQLSEIIDFTNSIERQLIILISIYTKSNEKLTNGMLSDFLGTSSRTIQKDIKSLKQNFEKEDVIQFSNNQGFYISDSSKELVKIFIANKLVEVINENHILSFIEFSDYVSEFFFKFQISDKNQLVSLIEFVLVFFKDILTSYSLQIIAIYISLIFSERGRENQKSDFTNSRSLNSESVLTEEFLDSLSSKFGFYLNRDELLNLNHLINSLPKIQIVQGLFSDKYLFEIELSSERMIQKMADKQNIPYYLDRDLPSILTNHLTATLTRIENNNQISNPLKSEVLNHYQSTLVDMKEITLQLPIFNGINEDELTYLTLYFVSSYEKIQNALKERKKCILFSYLSNANIRVLRYKLQSIFNLDIVVFHDIDNFKKFILDNEVDLIITTEQVQEISFDGIPTVEISSMLTVSQQNELFSVINNLVEKYQYFEREINTSKLLEIMPRELCIFKSKNQNFIELLKEGCGLLKDNGYTTKEHSDILIRKFEELTDIKKTLLLPGIVFPHIGLSKSVLKPGLALITLDKPLEYKKSSVQFILIFCSTNRSVHQEAMAELAYLLDTKGFISKLSEVSDYKYLKKIINRE